MNLLSYVILRFNGIVPMDREMPNNLILTLEMTHRQSKNIFNFLFFKISSKDFYVPRGGGIINQMINSLDAWIMISSNPWVERKAFGNLSVLLAKNGLSTTRLPPNTL